MTTLQRVPGWLIDALVAVAAAVVGLALERMTDGRLFSSSVVLWAGIGTFLLLRLGALFGRAGRTLGCGFAFVITWLLPCGVVLAMVANPALRRVVRDSVPFFIYLGFLLILIMVMTFERVRLADEQRHGTPRAP